MLVKNKNSVALVSVMEDVDIPKLNDNSQEDRCFLRERYLKATASLVGKQCSFLMLGGKTVTGVFRGADIEFQNILVDNLDVSNTKIKHSILRAGEIMTMKFNSISEVHV